MSEKKPQSDLPAHAAAPNTHARVFELVQQYFPQPKNIVACDVPCGAGSFSVHLAALGMKVTAIDVAAVEPFLFDANQRVLADVNAGLPLPDASLDALITIEGIEHLENPSFFLRECARVTKQNGWIFLSTPNVDSMRSRRTHFTKGFARYFNPLSATEKTSGHQLPVDMVFVRGAADRAGLEVVEVAVNRIADWFLLRFIKNLLRPFFTSELPVEMRGEIPFFGEVIIYVMRHKRA